MPFLVEITEAAFAKRWAPANDPVGLHILAQNYNTWMKRHPLILPTRPPPTIPQNEWVSRNAGANLGVQAPSSLNSNCTISSAFSIEESQNEHKRFCHRPL